MTSIPTFFEKELSDQYAVENFSKLKEFLVSESPWVGFRFFEVEFKAAATNFDFNHNLAFQPKDAILTFASNSAVVSFQYDSFTKDTVRLTVSAACIVRFLIGAFK
jgi:hypothetical protein